ncbi:hypothetical protein EVAR_95798_1 [Eumeta japonica]|uniref:Uncharacterized protein n=1 Tax=Eumeta variegata TaxID=151549 RepID=A0A4C1W4Z4_EUMVA|nr:hypothetical protein EVAR_95798_1 [Eumeta japonica]
MLTYILSEAFRSRLRGSKLKASRSPVGLTKQMHRTSVCDGRVGKGRPGNYMRTKPPAYKKKGHSAADMEAALRPLPLDTAPALPGRSRKLDSDSRLSAERRVGAAARSGAAPAVGGASSARAGCDCEKSIDIDCPCPPLMTVSPLVHVETETDATPHRRPQSVQKEKTD